MSLAEVDRWFELYARIQRSMTADEPPPNAACPSCGACDVHVLWVGDPSSRIGFAQAWCEACFRGVRTCRVVVPAGAPMLRFDEQAAAPAILDRITWVAS